MTGSSSGIGRAVSLRYAHEGARLICADLTPTARTEDEASITTHESIIHAGGQAIFMRVDIGDAGAMESLVAAAVAQYGRLDMSLSCVALINLLGLQVCSYPDAG